MKQLFCRFAGLFCRFVGLFGMALQMPAQQTSIVWCLLRRRMHIYICTYVHIFIRMFLASSPLSFKLYSVAVCCSALLSIAVHCSVLQCIVVHCIALHYVAVRCSALQCIVVCCSMLQYMLQYVVLQYFALCCSVPSSSHHTCHLPTPTTIHTIQATGRQ